MAEEGFGVMLPQGSDREQEELDTQSIRGVDSAITQLERTISGSDPLTAMLLNRQSQEGAASEAARTAAERQRMAQSGLSETVQMTGARQTARDVATARSQGLADLGGQLVDRQAQATRDLASIGFQEDQARRAQESLNIQRGAQEASQSLAERRLELEQQGMEFSQGIQQQQVAQQQYQNMLSSMDFVGKSPEEIAAMDAQLEQAWNTANPGVPYPGAERLIREQQQAEDARVHSEQVENLNARLSAPNWTDTAWVEETKAIWQQAYPEGGEPSFDELVSASWDSKLADFENNTMRPLFEDSGAVGQFYQFNDDTNTFDVNFEFFNNMAPEQQEAFEEWYRLQNHGEGMDFWMDLNTPHGTVRRMHPDAAAWIANNARAFGMSEFQQSVQAEINNAATIFPGDIEAQDRYIDTVRMAGSAFNDIGDPDWQESATGDVFVIDGTTGEVATELLPDYLSNAGTSTDYGNWTLTGDSQVYYDQDGVGHTIGEDGYEVRSVRTGWRSSRDDIYKDGVLVQEGAGDSLIGGNTVVTQDGTQFTVSENGVVKTRQPGGGWANFEGTDNEINEIKSWISGTEFTPEAQRAVSDFEVNDLYEIEVGSDDYNLLLDESVGFTSTYEEVSNETHVDFPESVTTGSYLNHNGTLYYVISEPSRHQTGSRFVSGKPNYSDRVGVININTGLEETIDAMDFR